MSPRNRWLTLSLGAGTIALGLFSRSQVAELPKFFATYAGDTLWALLVFFGVCFLWPRAESWRLALGAVLFAFAIEFSQLYHAPWIDGIRQTTLGALVLGSGFKASDLVCYSLGIALGVLIDRAVHRTADETNP